MLYSFMASTFMRGGLRGGSTRECSWGGHFFMGSKISLKIATFFEDSKLISGL